MSAATQSGRNVARTRMIAAVSAPAASRPMTPAADEAGALPGLLALLGQLGPRQRHLLADELRRLGGELLEELPERGVVQATVVRAEAVGHHQLGSVDTPEREKRSPVDGFVACSGSCGVPYTSLV